MRRVTLFVNGTSKNGKVSEHTQYTFSLANSSKCCVDRQRCPVNGMKLYFTLFNKDTENC